MNHSDLYQESAKRPHLGHECILKNDLEFVMYALSYPKKGVKNFSRKYLGETLHMVWSKLQKVNIST